MIKTFGTGLASLLLLGGMSGCGGMSAPSGPPVSSGALAPPADPLPARPREIRVDGLDPCTLASSEVLREAGVPNKPHVVPSKAPGVHGCSWGRPITQSPSGSLGVAVATQQDVRGVLGVQGAEITSAAGFGAVAIPNPDTGAQYSCDVRIDVAPNQGIWVDYLVELQDEPGATHELMCQRAHTAAETIMRDLLARTK
jgi:hypothetical protein